MSGPDETPAVTMAMDRVIRQLRVAETKWPGYPVDLIIGAAIVAEEAGEVIKAALDARFSSGSREDLKTELAQTAAVSLRMLAVMEEVDRDIEESTKEET